MRISIVTISYNQAAFIERAIRSIVQQDYPGKQYILVDAGSTDGSREIIAGYGAEIDRIILEPDDGPADGLNKGFRHASGDILGYINADDALLPGALGKVADFFNRRDIDVLHGGGFMIDEHDRVLHTMVPTRISAKRLIYGGATTFQQGTFFRREVFESVGGFNKANRTCWDGELLIDLALKGARFGRIHEPLAIFKIHPGSISGSGSRYAEYEKDRERLFRKVMNRGKTRADRFIELGYRTLKQLETSRRLYTRAPSTISAS